MTKEEARIRVLELKNGIDSHKECIQHLEGEIVELEAIIDKKDNWRDKLAKGDYAVIGALDGLSPCFGFQRIRVEHTFKTVEEAKLLADKMNLMQEMHAFAHVRNEGWVPDWTNLSEEKFGILYSTYEGIEVDNSMGCNYFIFGIVVSSEEIAQEMLGEFGERIKEIYNKQY